MVERQVSDENAPVLKGKLDQLLGQLIAMNFSVEQAWAGMPVSLEKKVYGEIIKECKFANRSELAFFMRSLQERGLIKEFRGSPAQFDFKITMDGYMHAEAIGVY